MQQQEVTIQLRPYQAEACNELDRTKFGVLIAHRRFGKTVLAVTRLIRNAVNTTRNAHRGAYIAPLYRQAKAVAWDFVKFFGGRLPGVKFHETDLTASFPNGARISLHGADNPDSLRGLDLRDVVFDEVADMPFRVWAEIVYPMLVSNNGTALFIGTPRGKNALYDVWTTAQRDPKLWTTRMYKADETGILSAEALAQAKREMDPDEYAQEFMCSFAAGVKGAYYAHLIDKAEKEGRIADVPVDPAIPVGTVWDLGVSDVTAIWFWQQAGARDVRLVDYYENNGEGLPHYANMLAEKGYRYGRHIGPHDIRVRELGTGKSRIETAAGLGIRFDVAPMLTIADGIQAVRNLLPICRIDRGRCEVGLTALRHYKREFDDKHNTYRSAPLHDWAEHASSSARYLAVSLQTGKAEQENVIQATDKKSSWGF